jgi:hypothetical protein
VMRVEVAVRVGEGQHRTPESVACGQRRC